jgi:dCTP deaminase
MILSDSEIELALNQHLLVIKDRPDPKDINSTAIDLRLDGTLDRWVFPEVDENLGQKPHCFKPGIPGFKFADMERKYTEPVIITETAGFPVKTVPPDNFVLGWTLERIYLPHTSRLCARVEGKSSFARLGLGVHITAPTIHAGFGYNMNNPDDHGTKLRLEIWNVGPIPIELVKGMRICQLILEEVRQVPQAGGYRGGYNLQGPKPVS